MSPNALSFPASLPPGPAAPGVGLAEVDDGEDCDDEVLAVELLLDGDGVLDDPQAASDSAVNPVRATAAQRDT
jgi:hypothetical protein